jgi:hypothetical protein
MSMFSRMGGRTQYLLRMALSYALPLIADEDREDMRALLHQLNGDSWRDNDVSFEWQMEAEALVRERLERPYRTSTPPSPKVVPIRLVTTTDEAS